ncbi:MAG: nitroreductase family deazaflavin-dependent oxidoreductase [Knoellia sp.]
MGLAQELDYHHARANVAQQGVRRFAGSRAGAWMFSHTLRHLDAGIARLTHGQHSAPSLLSGLAVLSLTTTGRRSGVPRASHLIATPHGEDLALIGTNFGQGSTPAWVLNLEAHPQATLKYRGRSADVLARPATAEEADDIFRTASTFYPGYGSYRSRIAGLRRVRVFVLQSPAQP